MDMHILCIYSRIWLYNASEPSSVFAETMSPTDDDLNSQMDVQASTIGQPCRRCLLDYLAASKTTFDRDSFGCFAGMFPDLVLQHWKL